MNKKIIKFIKNKKLNISDKEKFVAIIGGNPSNGARSPKLWNRVYRYINKKIKMYPLDVSNKNVNKLINYLNKNKNFLGGSVTMPFKEKIFYLLKKNCTFETSKIEAINCLYRDSNNELKATNTDGEASVISFKNNFKKHKVKKILVVGCGGAGKAVSTYFSKMKSIKRLTIFSRRVTDKKFAEKIKANWINRKEISSLSFDYDLVVNCSSLGFEKQKKILPLPIFYLKKLNKKTIIYDIIYKPLETKLIKISNKIGFRTMNGLNMNLDQAAIAFLYVNKNIGNLNFIKKAMNGK